MNKMLASVVLAAACHAMPAFAGIADPVTHAAVRHADLDLARTDDIGRLDRRISTAIDDVCGEATDYDPVGANAIRRCRARMRAAVAPRRTSLITSARTRMAAAR